MADGIAVVGVMNRVQFRNRVKVRVKVRVRVQDGLLPLYHPRFGRFESSTAARRRYLQG